MGYDMKQKGFVLFVSLIFLVLMTMLGIAMFSGFITNQMIAGNLREKTRAYDAAQAAIDYTRFWLAQPGHALTSAGTPAATTVCAGTVTAINSPTPLCSDALATPTSLPWTTGVNYNPGTQMTISASGVNTYTVNPTFYVQYLGAAQSTGGYLFQVTTAGQGGNTDSVAVLQSVFQVTGTTNSLTGP